MANAVWKDLDIQLSTSSPIVYNIDEMKGENYITTVYTGVATPKPLHDYVQIRLSDFAKNICNSDEDDGLFNEEYEYFKMYNYHSDVAISYDINGIKMIKKYSFYNSYDYNNDSNFNENITSISNPIYNEYCDRGYVFISLYNTSQTDKNIKILSTTQGVLYSEMLLSPTEAGVFQLYQPAVGDYKVVTAGTDGEVVICEFKVKPMCCRYVLHYLNAKGGYDTMHIEGRKDKRTDEFVFDFYKSIGNNANPLKPQMNKFKVDITPRWTLQTGLLTDEQSLKMYNLFGSQKVWLEDTETNKIYPVYITDKAVDYKTYTNNGKKKISYTINVTSSNTLVKL